MAYSEQQPSRQVLQTDSRRAQTTGQRTAELGPRGARRIHAAPLCVKEFAGCRCWAALSISFAITNWTAIWKTNCALTWRCVRKKTWRKACRQINLEHKPRAALVTILLSKRQSVLKTH